MVPSTSATTTTRRRSRGSTILWVPDLMTTDHGRGARRSVGRSVGAWFGAVAIVTGHCEGKGNESGKWQLTPVLRRWWQMMA